MTIDLRAPTIEDMPEIARVDGRAFLTEHSDEEIERYALILDLDRFRVLEDDGADSPIGGRQIVGVAGSFGLDATLPGGSTVPIGGVTWVSVASTHRRRGLLRRLMDAVHQDIDERGEPLALLGASQGGIYERFGYGVATQIRTTVIDTRTARVRPEFTSGTADVCFVSIDEVQPHLAAIWERFRRQRAGELSRDANWLRFVQEIRRRPVGGSTATHYLCHPDGYAATRLKDGWSDGHPQGTIEVTEFAATTPDAHAALWATILSTDLVTTVTTEHLPLDDPLPYLLDDPRAVRTTAVRDGLWACVRDTSICFGARTYGTTDRLVVEVDGTRWAIDGSPEDASCTRVRTRPDLVTDHSTLGTLLFGTLRPSALAAARRVTARSPEALRRADAFFATGLLPHHQTYI